MFKILTLLLLTLFSLDAKSIVVDYVVEFGIVGQVAKVHTQYTDTPTTYTIVSDVSMVGLLSTSATGNLKERHICKGFISKKDHQRIATQYEMIKSYGNYKSQTLYRIDHKHRKVTRQYKKWQKKSRKYKKIIDQKKTLSYYATDDMVTLFLNLGSHLKDKKTPKRYRLKAVGADKKDGRVDIIIPNKSEAASMITLLGKPKPGEWIMNLIMHRQLYNSKQGELMVRMGSDSIIEKAVLKDILLFGDVRIIRQ